MQTAYQMVWMSAERTPNHLALFDDLTNRSLTYSELIIEVDIIAAGLWHKGVRKGDRVATILPSLFDHCLLLLALQRLCAVPALINFRLTSEEIGNLIKEGNIVAAVILPNKELLNAVKKTLPNNGVLLTIGKNVNGAERFE